MLVAKVNGLSVYIGEKTSLNYLLPNLHNVFLYLGVEKKKQLYTKRDLYVSVLQVKEDSVYVSVNNITLRIKEDTYQVNNGTIKPYDDKNLCLINLVLKFIRLAYFKDTLSMEEL